MGSAVKLRWKIWVPVIVGVLLLGAGCGVGYWAWAYYKRGGPLAETAVVVIPKGVGVKFIAEKLEDRGVIAHPGLFMLWARFTDVASKLKAGEYEFEPKISPKAAMEKMAEGKTLLRSITVVEGRTTEEILRQVMMTEGLDGLITQKFKEGELLPETYHFSYGDSRDGILLHMKKAMQDFLDENWEKRAGDLPLVTKEQVVTMASIVEKETSLQRERGRIAAVFINRLKRNMPLQADPTVVYAVNLAGYQVERGALTVDHLKYSSPYNTYLNPGLPPGPICSPGKASILAVLTPPPFQDLYFVADGTGGHAFATTLDDHNRNVARWRRIERIMQQEKK